MIMIPTLSSFIESLTNSAGRFKTLDRIFPRLNEKGELDFKVSSRMVSFSVEWLGRPYTLRCFLADKHEIRSRADQLSLSVSPSQSEYIAESRYLINEMLIYDELDVPHWCDVLLQSVPEGEPIHLYVKRCCRRGNEQPLEWLLGAVARMSTWMHENGIVHGNMGPENMIVTPDLILILTDYQVSLLAGANDLDEEHWLYNADNFAIAKTAISLFCVSCRPDLCAKLCSTVFYHTKTFISLLPAVWTVAKKEELHELMNLVSLLLESNDRLKDRAKLDAMITDLLDCPIKPYPAFAEIVPPCLYSCAPDFQLTRSELSGMLWVGALSEGLIRVMDENGKWSYIFSDGRMAIESHYDYAEDFSNGRAVVETDGNFGLIDQKGNYIVPASYDSVMWYGDQGVGVIERDGLSFLVDSQGERMSRKGYDWIGMLEEGLMPVRKGRKYGFINTRSEEVIPLVYDDAYSFVDGRALVTFHGASIYIDKSGNKTP